MLKNFALCVALGLSMCVCPASAQEVREAQIEVVLFAFAQPGAGASLAPELDQELGAGIDLSDSELPESARKLNVAAQRLAQDRRTSLLGHAAWRQDLNSRQWVRLASKSGDSRQWEARLNLRVGKPLSLSLQVRLAGDEADAGGTSAVYRLGMTRPTHYSEVQYFDHPAIGALVRVDAVVAGEMADEIAVESD